jgi:hypothetical protein
MRQKTAAEVEAIDKQHESTWYNDAHFAKIERADKDTTALPGESYA